MPSKSLWNSQRNPNTLCDSSKTRTFLPSPTLLETLYAIGLDAVQKSHENPEWNANELCGPSENRSFLAWSTPLEIIHHFSLDAVQKTTRAEKYVNELSGSLRNDTLEQDQHHYSTRDNLFCFRLDAVQKTMKTEKNVNELTGPPENRSFLALSILPETNHNYYV